ncbi:MAG: 4-hydroxy-tetrahydrodipicolinate reductase [bacterium]
MVKTIVCGVSGRMGTRIVDLLRTTEGVSFFGGVEHKGSYAVGTHIGEAAVVDDLSKIVAKADAVIDFTQPKATLENLAVVLQNKKPIVIGTTGFSEEEKEKIRDAARSIPVCFSPNMSIGVNVMFKLVSEAARLLGKDYDVEVIEAHHRLKKDAPSGTAMKIADVLLEALSRTHKDLRFDREGLIGERKPNEIGMQTIRGGDIVGDHTVMFAGIGERLEITHRATNRDNFARGAVLAAKWLVGKPAGLYDMQDVLGLK